MHTIRVYIRIRTANTLPLINHINLNFIQFVRHLISDINLVINKRRRKRSKKNKNIVHKQRNVILLLIMI